MFTPNIDSILEAIDDLPPEARCQLVSHLLSNTSLSLVVGYENDGEFAVIPVANPTAVLGTIVGGRNQSNGNH